MTDAAARLRECEAHCNEQLATARSIKGDAFANAASAVFEINQSAYLFGELLAKADLEEGEKQMFRVACSKLLSSVTQTVCGTLKSEDAEEAFQLGERMSERFEHTFLMEG